jgi:competence protein ComEA
MNRLLALIAIAGFVVLAQCAGNPPVTDRPPGTAARSPVTDQKRQPLDINTASMDDLTALPGIDDARAKRIMAARPYKDKDELVKKGILSQATYDKIKEQIVAGQPRK